MVARALILLIFVAGVGVSGEGIEGLTLIGDKRLLSHGSGTEDRGAT